MKCLSTKLDKSVKSLESKKAALGNGPTKGRSRQLGPPGGCDCLTSLLSTHQSFKDVTLRKNALSCTLESPLPNKKMTCNAKNNTLKTIFLTNVPDPNLTTYQTLDQALTLKDKDCYRFWDASRKEKYQQLSWLQKTAWQGLDLNSSNGSAPSTEPKFWFSTLKIQPPNQSLEKISWPSFKFTVADGMESEDMVKEKIKARKLMLRPTQAQKRILDQWASCSRFLYNKAVALLMNKKNKTLRSKYKLRDRLVTITGKRINTKNNFYNNKPWLLKCPKAVKQGAIQDARSNVSSCFTNLRNKNIKTFTAPYRTKKQERKKGWSLTLEKNNVSKHDKKLFIFKTFLGEMRYFKTKQLNKLIKGSCPNRDCKLQKSKYGEYFLVVPYVCKPKREQPKECFNPASGDPGIRKFITTYSLNESLIIGNRWSTILMEELLKLDSMISRNEKRQKVQKQGKRIDNLKRELRFQAANLISKRYDLFMMPKLEVKRLSEKSTRKLKTKVVRALLTAGHCKFFDTLKDKCWENGCRFLQVREEYTSQTCPECGELNKCGETYKCQSCGFGHDRDVVGALNIMLKAVRDNPSIL